MTRSWLSLVGLLGACAVEEEPFEPRYTGTFRVTQRAEVSSQVPTGAIFGRITIPSELDPTARVDGCDYWAVRARLGISLGELTVEGLGTTYTVEPESYINGTVYDRYIPGDGFAEAAPITAVLHEARDLVTIEATTPPRLSNVALPETVSLVSAPTIAWTPSDADEVTVALALSETQALYCKTTDSGRFVFPAAALALIDGSDDDATLSVTRRNVGEATSMTADAHLVLAVESKVFRSVSVTR